MLDKGRLDLVLWVIRAWSWRFGLGLKLTVCQGIDTISHSLLKLVGLIFGSGLSDSCHLALLLQQEAHSALLLADEWHGVKLFLPVFGDNDGLLFHLLTLDGVPLAVGVFYNFLHIFRVHRVPHIVHVLTVAGSADRKFVWEVFCHAWTLNHSLI